MRTGKRKRSVNDWDSTFGGCVVAKHRLLTGLASLLVIIGIGGAPGDRDGIGWISAAQAQDEFTEEGDEAAGDEEFVGEEAAEEESADEFVEDENAQEFADEEPAEGEPAEGPPEDEAAFAQENPDDAALDAEVDQAIDEDSLAASPAPSASATPPLKCSGRLTGVVKSFNKEKGYGIITPRVLGDGDVFVHHSAIQGSGRRDLAEGEVVEFDLTCSRDGKRAAENVTRLG